jgi:hypothetical protein
VKTVVVVLLGLVAGANIGEARKPSRKTKATPEATYTVGLALGARVASGSAA